MTEEIPQNTASEQEDSGAQAQLTIEDLRPGMVLTGKVVNIAKFGAFVDIGVGQDGLIHISALSDEYVKRVEDVVRVGDVVEVTVLEVDPQRKRISLSMRDSAFEEEDVAEEDEPMPTAMELALRRALEGAGESKEERKRRREKRRQALQEQEELLARTLLSLRASRH